MDPKWAVRTLAQTHPRRMVPFRACLPDARRGACRSRSLALDVTLATGLETLCGEQRPFSITRPWPTFMSRTNCQSKHFLLQRDDVLIDDVNGDHPGLHSGQPSARGRARNAPSGRMSDVACRSNEFSQAMIVGARGRSRGAHDSIMTPPSPRKLRNHRQTVCGTSSRQDLAEARAEKRRMSCQTAVRIASHRRLLCVPLGFTSSIKSCPKTGDLPGTRVC